MMESSGDHSFLRNRRLGNFLESNQGFRAEETKIPKPKEGVGLRSTSEAFVDDNSWSAVLISVFRIVMCFMTMMITTSIWAIVMVVLIPWPNHRIKQGNVYGHVTGRLLMWILGNPIKIEGAEFSDSKAIYICNHASPLDIFLVMWLAPTGTVGIAKKQIIWYPFFGQLYVLANHIRIDRSNPATAIESLKVASRFIIKYNLSLIIFPEGTRSQTGRLLPFKKIMTTRRSVASSSTSDGSLTDMNRILGEMARVIQHTQRKVVRSNNCQPVERVVDYLKDFKRLNPPTFQGLPDHMEAEKLIM